MDLQTNSLSEVDGNPGVASGERCSAVRSVKPCSDCGVAGKVTLLNDILIAQAIPFVFVIRGRHDISENFHLTPQRTEPFRAIRCHYRRERSNLGNRDAISDDADGIVLSRT